MRSIQLETRIATSAFAFGSWTKANKSKRNFTPADGVLDTISRALTPDAPVNTTGKDTTTLIPWVATAFLQVR
jgi:hypothetical protein